MSTAETAVQTPKQAEALPGAGSKERVVSTASVLMSDNEGFVDGTAVEQNGGTA